jgi:hypothetical protein
LKSTPNKVPSSATDDVETSTVVPVVGPIL